MRTVGGHGRHAGVAQRTRHLALAGRNADGAGRAAQQDALAAQDIARHSLQQAFGLERQRPDGIGRLHTVGETLAEVPVAEGLPTEGWGGRPGGAGSRHGLQFDPGYGAQVGQQGLEQHAPLLCERAWHSRSARTTGDGVIECENFQARHGILR